LIEILHTVHCELNIGGCKINSNCVVVFNFGVKKCSGVVTVSAASDSYFISPAI